MPSESEVPFDATPEAPHAAPETADAAPRRPRLSLSAQTHYDARRDRWVLLGPDCMLELEPDAHALLARLDGRSSPAQIAAALARGQAGRREEMARRLEAILTRLRRHGLVDFV